jgi:hypothetical protein
MARWAIVCIMTPAQAARENRSIPCYFSLGAPSHEPVLYDTVVEAQQKCLGLLADHSQTNYFVVEYHG